MAARASFLAKNLPKLVKAMKSGDVGYIIVNQLRERIGATAYQKQTYSPGGRALRHWAHLRLEMTPFGAIRKGSGENAEVVGFKTRVKVIKNKVAPPFREALLEVYFDPPRIVDPAAPSPAREVPVAIRPPVVTHTVVTHPAVPDAAPVKAARQPMVG